MTRRALLVGFALLAGLVVLLALPSAGAAALVQGGQGRAERLTGTSKVDRLLAGRGNDVIFARDRRADYVNCGPGFDRAILDQIDRQVGCEKKRYPPTAALVWPPFLLPHKQIHPAVYAGRPGSVTRLRPGVPRPPKPTPPKPAPPLPIPPQPVPVGGPVFGLVANADRARALEVADRLDTPFLRVEFGIGESAGAVQAVVDQARARGIEVLPQAGFHGRIPTDAEARNVGAWAQALDGAVRWIEFGNETGFRHQGTHERGAAYGRTAGIACAAAAGSGVGLLVQGDDGSTDSGWVGEAVAAAPSLRACAAGWVVHPYGPREKWEPRLQEVADQLAAAGVPVTARLFLTEWGIATDDGAPLNDNYGWPLGLSYAATGEAIAREVPAMLARFPRIKAFAYYSTYDLRPSGTGAREDYFGVLQDDLSPKGAVTEAIRALGARYRG